MKPYQPAGLWQELSGDKGYVQAKGDGPVPPQPVHILEAHGPAALHDELRFAQSRDSARCSKTARTRRCRRLESDERRHLPGGVAQAGRAHDAGRRRDARTRIDYGYRWCSRGPPSAARRSSPASTPYDEFEPRFRDDPKAAAAFLHAAIRCAPGTGRRRTGRLRRVASLILNMDESHHQGITMIDPAPFLHWIWHWRRYCCKREPNAEQRGLAGLPAFRSQSKARHLPVPIRRPFADRTVRLQAAAGRVPGHRTAGVDPQRPAAHRHVGVAGHFPCGALEIRLGATRPVGRMGGRTAAIHGEDRRPAHLRQDASTPKRSITILRSP